MSLIISFGNLKGGVGKTCLTCMCANALSQTPFNYKVLVIDTDYQKSIMNERLDNLEDFNGIIPYDVLAYNIETLQQKISKLDTEYDFIFIDVPGKLDTNISFEEQEVTRVLQYVDYLFLPFISGSFALDASIQYLQYLLQVRATRSDSPRPLNIVGLINKYRSRSRRNQHLLLEVDTIKKATGIEFLKNRLGDLSLFADVDTLTSYYQEDTTDNAKINFMVFLNEFIKTLTNG